jgi:predicted transcriptional regulator
MAADTAPDRAELLRMTAQITSAYVQRNQVSGDQLPELIRTVYAAMSGPGEHSSGGGSTTPAVPIKKSIMPDYIVCLEDGRKLKMLKRHLRTAYGLSPEQYRQKWGLAPDYPMVAPNYAQQRSVFAKKIGLGRRPGGARRGRPKK